MPKMASPAGNAFSSIDTVSVWIELTAVENAVVSASVILYPFPPPVIRLILYVIPPCGRIVTDLCQWNEGEELPPKRPFEVSRASSA